MSTVTWLNCFGESGNCATKMARDATKLWHWALIDSFPRTLSYTSPSIIWHHRTIYFLRTRISYLYKLVYPSSFSKKCYSRYPARYKISDYQGWHNTDKWIHFLIPHCCLYRILFLWLSTIIYTLSYCLGCKSCLYVYTQSLGRKSWSSRYMTAWWSGEFPMV